MENAANTWARQLLIALDENPAIHAALDYCGTMFGGDPGTGYRLVHCAVSAASSVIPPPVDNVDTLIPDSPVHKPQTLRYRRLFDRGSAILKSHGIQPKNIATSVIPSLQQVSSALLVEADTSLADAIVVARRGIGYFGEMILGSVSASLFRDVPSTPLWIIDGTVSDKNILIGVDGSIHSLRAVDHVAHMLKDRRDIKIHLYHCAAFLAPEVVCTLERFYEQWDKTWCDTHLAGDGCLFGGPAQLLRDAGIAPEQVVVLPQTKRLEESTSIIAQARKNRCGTIVVGRRGPSVAKGFFGGVSNRTIRQTQNMAVWVVS